MFLYNNKENNVKENNVTFLNVKKLKCFFIGGKTMIKRFKNKKGQGMIEYVIIMALLVVAAIGVLTALGGVMKNKFSSVSDALEATGN